MWPLGHHNILTVDICTQINTQIFRRTSNISDIIQQFTRHNDGNVKNKRMFDAQCEKQENRPESKFA
jgi:hypothetical protein